MTAVPLSPLAASALVAAGGAVGAMARYHAVRIVTAAFGPDNSFPWGTLSVNIIGSLLMGALLGWLARGSVSGAGAESARLFIGVGLLGGFTTFSAFSAELVTLVHRGEGVLAAGYGAASLIAGMAALLVGLLIAQSAP